MNEIFNTLRDKFPFLSLIRKGDLEFVGIVQNQDTNVISFYDYGRLMLPKDKMRFLKCGETWWYESNRKLPINIALLNRWNFQHCVMSFNVKQMEIVSGPEVRLANCITKRIKRRNISLIKKNP